MAISASKANHLLRDSNLDLLRILAMLMIVAHHFIVHGTIPTANPQIPFTANLYMAQILGSGGRLGVDLLVLLTGWFLSAGSIKISSLAKLWSAVFFYSVLAFLFFTFVLQHRPFSNEEIVRTTWIRERNTVILNKNMSVRFITYCFYTSFPNG